MVRRRRTALAVVLALALLVFALTRGGGFPGPPPAPSISSQTAGDPFGYRVARQAEFERRAAVGYSGVLFSKSPGGAVATATRVAGFRSQVESAARGSGIDPNLLEGIVFVESAGRPQVMAGSDPAAAAGLTQILADTGTSLLGMSIDLPRSRALTRGILLADAQGNQALFRRLVAQRARIDQRFDPAAALKATIRYLRTAETHFGRADLAVVSYHMGIGNLASLLSDYDGGRPVPYAQLFFDTSPTSRPAAYRRLTSFGDQSMLYYWRVLGAEAIMRLYRTDPAALRRLADLQSQDVSGAAVLHPPDRTTAYADPGALSDAYGRRELVPLPANAGALGLSYGSGLGAAARRLGAPPALYRGLRPAARELLVALAARVRALSRSSAPLQITGAVTDRSYQRALGYDDPVATSGYGFQIARRYATRAQAVALQAMLDRLQGLNLIAWSRSPVAISVSVSDQAPQVVAHGV